MLYYKTVSCNIKVYIVLARCMLGKDLALSALRLSGCCVGGWVCALYSAKYLLGKDLAKVCFG